ncbi:hypothetical protein [Micromonospora sp. LOL_024]|uniref:hypothetical protein n=1 Tax=Micromonospora sp. LOL_024 TaxID=3345412 RepID=UPI003A85F3A5
MSDQPPHPDQPLPYPDQPSAGWYQPAGYGLTPADPLVTPPGAGLGGWFARCLSTAGRGWRLLLPILVLTQVLPLAMLSVLTLAVDPSARWDAEMAGNSALPVTFWSDLSVLLFVLVGGSLVFGLVQCLGWAAGAWVIARQAAGEPVGFGAALRYGLRRALGLWGWTLIVTLIVAIGFFCCCFLPGIYAGFALAMAGPVYLFERQEPISRSHRMLRARLGLLLGRVALVAAAAIGVALVAGVVESLAIIPFGVTPLNSPGTAVGALLAISVGALLALPAHLAQLVGLVVTYAEQRAHEGPVNAGQLAVELG